MAIWNRYRLPILYVGIVLLMPAASYRLVKETSRYLINDEVTSGYDIEALHNATRAWSGGEEFYEQVRGGVHPPATYVMLWPMMGWGEVESARVLWLLMMLGGLALLAGLFARECRSPDFVSRLFLFLVPLAGYAASTVILVGQTTIHVMVVLLLAGMRLERAPRGWAGDLATAGLLIAALLKPTMAAPFFWLAVFLPGRIRIAVLTATGYTLLSWAAILLRGDGLLRIFADWIELMQTWERGTEGHAHLHRILALVGLEDLRLVASVGLLGAFGVWVFSNRRAEVWTLMGVTAIFGRLWIYHRIYDDLIMLPAMVALWRLAHRHKEEGWGGAAPAILFVVNLLCMLAPSSVLRWDSPIAIVMEVGTGLVWLVTLVYLAAEARCGDRSAEAERSFDAGKRQDPVADAIA